MPAILIERHGDTATLRLGREHGNAINGALVEDLHGALDSLACEPAVRGILLASAHPKIFCPGLDLRELFPLERAAMTRFVERFCAAYLKLFVFPKPVVAAIAGHAVAGGCVLAMCADWRVLRDAEILIGLNEVKLGVGLPWGVVALVGASVPSSRQAEAALFGRNFSGAGAVEAGLAQELAAAGEVESRARERLAELSAKDPAAFASIKGHLKAATAASIREGDRAHAAEFLDLWFSGPTRRMVGEAVRGLEKREAR